MEANLYMVPPNNSMWCCDIVSRLNNDIQSLSHDLQILFKLQHCYKGLQKQFDQLFSQLENRLKGLPVKKLKASGKDGLVTSIHIDEFVVFIRKVWESISENLNNENKARFISFIRGAPLRLVVDELMNFCFHCSRTLLPKFHHQQCSQVFAALTNQLNYKVFPEVEFVDSFEQSLKLLTSSLPCLINLITIVDLYTYCPKYGRIETLCNDLFDTAPPLPSVEFVNFIPPWYLWLPDGPEEYLEERGPDLEYVSFWAPRMASYVVKMSVVPRRFSTIRSQPHGVLNSGYMACTNALHQDDGVTPGRRRGRSSGRRGFSKDLNPIKVPKLSILPFAY